MSNIETHVPLFLIPIYAIITFNGIAFVLVIRVLIKQKNKRKSRCESDISSHIKTMASIVSIMVVYGIFWLTGVLNVREAAIYFQWPFLILNVFQGVLIFLLIGIFNTYKEWIALFSARMKKEIKTASLQHQRFNGYQSKSDSTKETSYACTSGVKSEGDSTFTRNFMEKESESESNQTPTGTSREEIDMVVFNADIDGDLEIQLDLETSLSPNNKTAFD